MSRTNNSSYGIIDIVDKVSVRTPNYRQLKALKQPLPENDYYYHSYKASSGTSNTYNGYKNEFDAGTGSPSPWAAVVNGKYESSRGNRAVKRLDEILGVAQSRLLSKVRSTKWDAGVALGEFRETASFVSSATARLNDGYTLAFSGKTDKALRTLMGNRYKKASTFLRELTRRNHFTTKWRDLPDAASQTWLMMNYAAAPLLRDIADAVETFQNRLDTRSGEIVNVRSGYDHTESVSLNLPFSATPWNNSHESASWKITVRNRCQFEVSNPALKRLDELGLTNPLAIAWELVPLSFVVDWFIPVGKFFENVVPPYGATFISGSETIGMDAKFQCQTNLGRPPWELPDYKGWHTASAGSERVRSRKINGTFPSPPPLDWTPQFDLSKSQVASSLALLWQTLTSPPKRRIM